MSGTLPDINMKENLFGIEFKDFRKFRLGNRHKLFLSRLTHVGPNNNKK